MQVLADQIMERASTLPEGAPIAAKSLLHLGTRAESDASILNHPGSEEETFLFAAIKAKLAVSPKWYSTRLAQVKGVTEETTTGVHRLYQMALTNGRSRTFSVGKQTVEFQHAPAWQLLLADRPAGEAVRALAWLGPDKAGMALETLKRKLGPSEFGELVSVGPRLPSWLARSVSQAAHV
ncbi:MAG: hypothetical protein B7Z42_07105 [Brevundimonas sp. 12-68-7]|nr:MAG: hypothetical protein B7Z42_07105 [Brevundimonas sp. 12-68-7]